MPRRLRPRRGTMQFWPRKRAKRIYPRISHWSGGDAKQPVLGFAGWKAGMTHVHVLDTDAKSPTYGRDVFKAATIIDAPPVFVLGMRFYKKTDKGLMALGEKWAGSIPKEINLEKKAMPCRKQGEIKDYDMARLIVATQPAKSGMRKKKPEVFEIGISKPDETLLGKEISAGVFKPGEFVDVSAVTKGKGFTGPVKRFGIRIQTRKDKQMHRHVGSIGSQTPRKVDWRVPAAGQHGFHTRTDLSKRILMIDNDIKKVLPEGGFLGYGIPKSFIMLEGSVPGPRKRLVILRHAARQARAVPAEIKYISLASKQGK